MDAAGLYVRGWWWGWLGCAAVPRGAERDAAVVQWCSVAALMHYIDVYYVREPVHTQLGWGKEVKDDDDEHLTLGTFGVNLGVPMLRPTNENLREGGYPNAPHRTRQRDVMGETGAGNLS
jgi:hypothetical protein